MDYKNSPQRRGDAEKTERDWREMPHSSTFSELSECKSMNPHSYCFFSASQRLRGEKVFRKGLL